MSVFPSATVLLAGALLLVACSGSPSGQGPEGFVMPTGPVTVPSTNPEPGSIESVRQDLSDDCDAAVSSMRDLMERYESVLDVPYDGTYDEAFQAAKAGCGAEEFRRFHDRELLGWIYAR